MRCSRDAAIRIVAKRFARFFLRERARRAVAGSNPQNFFQARRTGSNASVARIETRRRIVRVLHASPRSAAMRVKKCLFYRHFFAYCALTIIRWPIGDAVARGGDQTRRGALRRRARWRMRRPQSRVGLADFFIVL
jgi:hypothetical protein